MRISEMYLIFCVAVALWFSYAVVTGQTALGITKFKRRVYESTFNHK